MPHCFEPQLSLPEGSRAPDQWSHGDGVQLRLDHVISKDGGGVPISLVGDFVWNWKHYTTRKKTANLIFYFWKTQANRIIASEDISEPRLALIRELQYLMVLRIYHSKKFLSYGSLYSDLFALRQFAMFAEEKRCSLKNFLEESRWLDGYVSGIKSSQCRDLVRWLNFLYEDVTVSQLGFEVAVPTKWTELKRRANDYDKAYRQTAPLPTRIYSGLINSVSAELSDIEVHQDRILAALREALNLHRDHKAKGWKMGASFGPDLIVKHDLADFLGIRGVEADLPGLTGAVTNIQRICKVQTHIFSGMRNEEAQYLPYNCMESVKAGHGKTHSLIVGTTTKLVGARRKRTRWVTTEAQGFRAIRLAQSFAAVIYEFFGVIPSTDEKTKDDFPLFVSTGYLPWMGDTAFPEEVRYLPCTTLNISALSESLQEALLPVIEEDDLEELHQIDPFRDWSNEPEFAAGMRWQLKSHQLRRSLAIYANASGLVKTSSLKRQLQHLTREMTEYYGKGSVFAKNFLSDDPVEYKKHVCREWQDTEQEAQYLAFARDVLNSDEPLCGPGGAFYELKKQRGEVMTAQEAKNQLKMGRMSYKAHPLGGCTHVGNCDKQKGLRLTSGICISESCKSLVGKHSAIIKIIPLQRQIVDNLRAGSIAFDMEKEELDILVNAEVKWRPSINPMVNSKRVQHA